MTTLREVLQLAPLVDAVTRNAKVTIAIDGDVTCLLTGTLRAFTPKGSGAFMRNDEDLWEGHVRVSATIEHWFTVRELIDGIHDGTVALDYPRPEPLDSQREAIKTVLRRRHRCEGAKRNFKTDKLEDYSEFDGKTEEIINAIWAAIS